MSPVTPIQDYWSNVRRRQRELETKYSKGAVFLYQHSGARVVEASIPVAAKALVENTHREATPDEIKKYQSDQEAESLRLQAEQLRRSNPQLSLPPEITTLLLQAQSGRKSKTATE